MKLTLTLNDLNDGLNTVSHILNDRLIQDDLKNIIFWVKDNNLRLLVKTVPVTAYSDVPCGIESETVDETFIQLKAKDLMNILNSFSSLKKTVVEKIEFVVFDAEVKIFVYEVASDETDMYADKYTQTSKFSLRRPRVKDSIIRELEITSVTEEFKYFDSSDVLLYLNALIPTVSKEIRDTISTRLTFSPEYIYTLPQTYAALMENRLDSDFSGFTLSSSIAGFIKSFIAIEEGFNFSKQVLPHMLVLTLKLSNAVAIIKCDDLSKGAQIQAYMDKPTNGIAIDKGYLMDVIRRASINAETLNLCVKIENGVADVKIESVSMTQDIPTMMGKGEGEYKFTIRPSMLSSLIFSHADYLDDKIFMYFDIQNDKIVLAVSDSSALWHTKTRGLTPLRG